MRALVIVVALSVTAFAARGITAWIDFGSRTEKATFYGTIVGDQQVWPAADRIAAWMHETALRLFPDSPYAKAHGGGPSSPRSAAQGQVHSIGPRVGPSANMDQAAAHAPRRRGADVQPLDERNKIRRRPQSI